jgi:O-antigen/teichoic acid export membrane protein
MQFRMMILLVTNAIATALLPRLIKTTDTNNFNQIRNIGYFSSILFCVLMIVVVCLIMPVIFLFYEIESSRILLTTSYLLLSTALPLCIYNLYTQTLIAKGKTKLLLLFNSFWGLVVILLYNQYEIIDNLSAAKILSFSYLALIIFIILFNKLRIINEK